MRRLLSLVILFSALTGILLSASHAQAATSEQAYGQAKAAFSAALAVPDQQGRASALQQCITKLQQVQREDPQGQVADRCLYLLGQCHHYLSDLTGNRAERDAAIEQYRTLTQRYSASPLADDAQYLIGMLMLAQDPSQAYVEFSKVCRFYPSGDMRPKAEQKLAQLNKRVGGKAEGNTPPQAAAAAPVSRPPAASSRAAVHVNKIQHWSTEDYSRVVVYLSAPTAFQESATAVDAQQSAKIYLTLSNCAVARKLAAPQRIADAFLQGIRTEASDSAQTRIVLDTRAVDSYRVFSMDDPFRVIIDVRGKKSAKPAVCQPVAPSPQTPAIAQPPAIASKVAPPKVCAPSMPSLARQLGLEIRRIVIDPGHGGKDKGAISPNNVYEKDITLTLARQLKEVLEAKTGCEVILTRTRDKTLSLEERTAIANTQKADLFISIHTNAHENHALGGIETYYLNFSKDKESARVAALENATSTRKLSDLEAILHDLMLNTKINESSLLATEVQSTMVNTLKTSYDNIRDLGVKQAPFYVLIGAEMPCILVETSFITNAVEEQRLRDKTYQESISRAIANGVESYITHMRSFARAGERS